MDAISVQDDETITRRWLWIDAGGAHSMAQLHYQSQGFETGWLEVSRVPDLRD